MKFKVGDRVVVTYSPYPNSWYRGMSPMRGDEGTVTGHIDGYVIVRFPNNPRPTNNVGDNGWRMMPNWISTVDEPR